MADLGVGIIGVGIFGENHCRAYTSDPATDIKALCDVNERRLNDVGDRFAVADRYTDYTKLLARDDIQAVSIATPDFLHREFAVAAAKAGKHILLEKPMATTVAECEAINSAVDEAGVTLMVDYHNRFNIPMALTKQSIDEGDLGDLVMMHVRLSDGIYVPTGMLNWAGDSTVAWFLASHCVDLIRWFFGSEVEKVYTVSRSRVLAARGIDTPDFFTTTLEMSCGGVATIENCWILADSMPSVAHFLVEAVGSVGHVEINAIQNTLIRKYLPDSAQAVDVAGAPDVYGRPTGFVIESIRHFVRCLKGEAEVFTDGKDAMEVTRVVCAIHDSSETGLPISLK